MKKNKKRKLDIIIYCSLIAAIICVGISAFDYASSLSAEDNFKSEVKGAIEEITTPNPEPEPSSDPNQSQETEEPIILQELDKNDIIRKHIDEIYDYYSKDQAVSYTQIKTWGNYEIYDITYLKQITDNYYSYQIKIKITNENPNIPNAKNEELSKDGATVLVMNANITRNTAGYYCKTLEIPKNE